MLEALVGCRSAAEVLLSLFVHGKCYGTALSRALGLSLTPLQKTLLRLEKAGIVLSHYEGKTRLYQLNPGYPLFEELEALLKKAFLLLPEEKKRMYSRQPQKISKKEARALLHMAWQQLQRVRRVTFRAVSRASVELGWNGRGTGKVVAELQGEKRLLFKEQGHWDGKTGQEMNFSNVFRWTLDEEKGVIRLEHLRRGWNAPVFLFDLVPCGKGLLASLGAHQCASDSYFGEIELGDYNLQFSWRIIGTKKNEEIDYIYSF